MPQITAIEQHKRGPGVRIVVDGSTWLDVDASAVIACGVRKGDRATEELQQRLREADERHRAYESALRLLSYRPRSEGELRARLRRSGTGDDTIEETVTRLRAAGLLDDARFAAQWVTERGSGASARGRRLLVAELRSRGVNAETVNQALVGADDEVLALGAARARARRLAGQPFPVFYRKLAGFLQRRGFDYALIAPVVKQLWRDSAGDGAQDDVE